MNNKDLYTILGISREAGAEEIKTAYRRLALKYHPDTNGEDKAGDRFKEINEAYSVLGNEAKRRDYDVRGVNLFHKAYDRKGAYGFQGCRSQMGFHHPFNCMRGRGLAGCFRSRQSGTGKAFRHPFSKYHDDRGDVYDIHLTKNEALAGAEKVIKIAKESKIGLLTVKTQSNLKEGDFLIMKNGHPLQPGRDVYLRVRIVD
jgi:DnaJ-class molecular chaperone